jgi:hypothetical protein
MTNPYLKTKVLCAGPLCQHEKGDQNHWFVVVPEKNDGPVIHVYNEVPIYYVLPFNELALTNPKALPVCGEACLTKLQSELLTRKS